MNKIQKNALTIYNTRGLACLPEKQTADELFHTLVCMKDSVSKNMSLEQLQEIDRAGKVICFTIEKNRWLPAECAKLASAIKNLYSTLHATY